jgi:branched-chain amino acid transport system permease protein
MKHLKPHTKQNLITIAGVLLAYVIVTALRGQGLLSRSAAGLLVPICCYVVMALSLNLTVGIMGELSLGHAGFMGVGAFSGIIASQSLAHLIPTAPLRLAIAMLIGAIFAAVFGFLIGIPVLRLRGDYLAIVTLAFGEIVKSLINNLYIGLDERGLRFGFINDTLHLMDGGKRILGGPMGATSVPKISTFLGGILLILFTLYFLYRLLGSRMGRAILAMRDNAIAAESVGIDITRYKLTAFTMSAFLAGSAGALFAMNFSTITASKFNIDMSILILVFVVLGGLGNLRGSILAAGVLTVLPELLRSLRDYRMLAYSVVLIAMMLLANNQRLAGWWTQTKKNFKRLLTRRKTAEGGQG